VALASPVPASTTTRVRATNPIMDPGLITMAVLTVCPGSFSGAETELHAAVSWARISANDLTSVFWSPSVASMVARESSGSATVGARLGSLALGVAAGGRRRTVRVVREG
jgi:hypothetical protein